MAKDSKTPFSNYKSAALRAELSAQNAETHAWTVATLYFSAIGRRLGVAAAVLYSPFSALNILAEK